MFAIFGSLFLGILAGFLVPDTARAARSLALATSCCIYTVVFAQGLGLGASDGFAQTWATTIVQGGLLCAIVLAVTVTSVELATRVRGRLWPARNTVLLEPATTPQTGFPWPVVIIVSNLAGGAVLGLVLREHVAPLSHLLMWPLYAMLVAIGLDLGRQRTTLMTRLRHAGDAVWVVPIILLASRGGGALTAWLLDLRPAAMMAGGVASAFYSISGPLVSELDTPTTGGIVFMANVLRETAAMVLVPLFPRLGLSLPAGASVGAACAMDSGLPFLVRSWGSAGAVMGLMVGLLISVLVPLLIPLMFALFP